MFGLSAAAVGGIAAIGGAGIGAWSANKSQKSAESQQDKAIEAAKMDPRMQAILYGNGTRQLKPGVTPTWSPFQPDANGENGMANSRPTNPDSDYGTDSGLLSQYQALGRAPQSAGLLSYGRGQDAYIGANGMQDMTALRNASNGLMNSSIAAPQAQAASAQTYLNGPAAQASGEQAQGAQAGYTSQVNPYTATAAMAQGQTYSAPPSMQAAQIGAPAQVSGAQVAQPAGMSATMAGAAQVNAPAQNNMSLTGSYDRLINGDAGANPYLTKALQGGINQSGQAFQRMQDDSTRNLMENVMPGIRSNSILSGQYGGSRQGIAEGRAMGDFGREQQRSIENFGNNNTAATVGAQAQAYNQGQDRALAATTSLSGQQYGVAQQNASNAQQSGMANAAASNAASQTNYQGLLSGAMANAGNAQQASLANQSAGLAAGTANAQLQQQAGQTNYGGLLSAAAGNASNLQQAGLANQAASNNASQFNAGQQQNASSQNANLYQNNSQFNAGLRQSNGQFNAGLGQSNNQFNAGLTQQNNQANTGFQNNGAQFNAGMQQQTGLSNAGFQGQANALNSSNQQAGLSAGSGLLNSALSGAQNQDRYAMDRASQMNGLLTPYLTGGGGSQVQPMYSNTAGNVLGGATAGLALGQKLGGMFGGGSNWTDNNGGGNFVSRLVGWGGPGGTL